MLETLKVGDVVAKRGELKKGWIKGYELNNGVRLDAPVLVMKGVEDGPTLLLTSTEHGIEIQGAFVIQTIMNKNLDPKKLRGTVIGIPVMNPSGFMAGRYDSWVDHRHISSVRADRPNGTASETLAYNLWEEAISKADIWINKHCNFRPDSLLYCSVNVADPTTREDNIKMAECFDYTTFYSERPFREDPNRTPTYGYLGEKKRIPRILVEYIDGRHISDPSQSTGVRGTLNVMKYFKMIDGEIEPQTADYVKVPGINRGAGMIRPRRGGLVNILKKPGELIKDGETVAEVYNLHGDLLEELKLPFEGEGYVWAYPCGDFENTGDVLQTVSTGCGFAFTFRNVTN